MAEPATTSATITMVAATATVPSLIAFGVPLGLRPDVLLAGFAGSLVAIILLNSVPSSGDTWQHLISTTLRRMAVVLASALTAGYLTPLALMIGNMPDSLFLGGAFAVGAGAQHAREVHGWLVALLRHERIALQHALQPTAYLVIPRTRAAHVLVGQRSHLVFVHGLRGVINPIVSLWRQ